MERKQSRELLEEAVQEQSVDVLNSGFLLPKSLFDKMYEHQKKGLAFLYEAYKKNKKGVILADDPGLGKTVQIVMFLAGMKNMKQIRSILLVMPFGLLENWIEQLKKWTPDINFFTFHTTNRHRVRNLNEVKQTGDVLLTTYKMLLTNLQTFSTNNEEAFVWDCVIFDEAHEIKNQSSKSFKAADVIPAKTRFLLSSSPVQNNFQELWSLFHLASQGSLLGTYSTFRKLYEEPIMRGREKDTSPSEIALGLQTSESLTEMIKPYYLRRTKEDIQRESKEQEQEPDKENQVATDAVQMAQISKKNDLVVWVYLSPLQERLYKKFISTRCLADFNLTDRGSLMKICNHPRLLTVREYSELLDWDELGLDLSHSEFIEDFDENNMFQLPSENLIQESGKIAFLVALLERLREEGNRVLVFSQSVKMLDIIERILEEREFKLLRVDGTVFSAAERHQRVTLFQTQSQYTVFLLTTKVGGVGFNLTAANRVVIVDPSWNPATDSQVLDRMYRIGQQKDVIVYRLITCGTIEEKKYRRQIFKNPLFRQAMGENRNFIKYFNKQDMKQFFTLGNTKSSSTQRLFQTLHCDHQETDKTLGDHLAYLHTLKMSGISDHNFFFSASRENDFNKESGQNTDQLQVQKPQEQKEAELHRFCHKTGLSIKKKKTERKRSSYSTDSDSDPIEDTELRDSQQGTRLVNKCKVSALIHSAARSQKDLSMNEDNFHTGHKLTTKSINKDRKNVFAIVDLTGDEPSAVDRSDESVETGSEIATNLEFQKATHLSFNVPGSDLIMTSTPAQQSKRLGAEDCEKTNLTKVLETDSIKPVVHNGNTTGTNDVSMLSEQSGHQTPVQLPILCNYSRTLSSMSSLIDSNNKSPSNETEAVSLQDKPCSEGRAALTISLCAKSPVFFENIAGQKEMTTQCARKLHFYEECTGELNPTEHTLPSDKVKRTESHIQPTVNFEEPELSGEKRASLLLDDLLNDPFPVCMNENDPLFESCLENDDLDHNLSTILALLERHMISENANMTSGGGTSPMQSTGKEVQEQGTDYGEDSFLQILKYLNEPTEADVSNKGYVPPLFPDGVDWMPVPFESASVSRSNGKDLEANEQKAGNTDEKKEKNPEAGSPQLRTVEGTLMTKGASNENDQIRCEGGCIVRDLPSKLLTSKDDSKSDCSHSNTWSMQGSSDQESEKVIEKTLIDVRKALLNQAIELERKGRQQEADVLLKQVLKLNIKEINRV